MTFIQRHDSPSGCNPVGEEKKTPRSAPEKYKATWQPERHHAHAMPFCLFLASQLSSSRATEHTCFFFFFSFCYVWACVCLHYLVTTSLSHTTSQEEVKLATYVAILQDTDRSHHKWNSVWNLNTLGSSRHQPLMHVRKITHFEHVKQRGKGYKKWEKGPRETNSTRTHLVCCKNASTFAL